MRTTTYWYDRVLSRVLLRFVPERIKPNHITIARMALTPLAVGFLAVGRYDIGASGFLFLALTDILDGSLARTRRQITPWGILWDPVADKILIGSVVVVLLAREFPPVLVATVLGLEAVFLIGGWLRNQKGIVTGANWWGKSKMICQVAAVTSFLLFLQTGLAPLRNASYAVFGLSALLAFCSLLAHGL